MRTLLLEEFIKLTPHPRRQAIYQLYESPFRPHHILLHFKGWEYDEAYGCFIDHTEERNMVWFMVATYFINGKEFRWPTTLNAFIADCRSLQIDLWWSEVAADQLWTPFSDDK